MPLLRSMLVTMGRDIEMSESSFIGAGARRLTTFGATDFDFSSTAI